MLQIDEHEKHANKWELENDTKSNEGSSLVLQTNGGPLHQVPLSVKHPNNSLLSLERIHLKAPNLSRDARASTYTKHQRGGSWYPFSCGSTGVSIFSNPNKISC